MHLTKTGAGQAYARLSGKALAGPENTALAAQVQTIFRGQALRGLLLNAYGCWETGQIMPWSAFTAYAAAALMALFCALGFAHLRRTAPQAEVLPGLATRAQPHTA